MVIISRVVGELRETEVGDFHAVLVRHKDVSSGQIAMNDFLLCEIIHALKQTTAIRLSVTNVQLIFITFAISAAKSSKFSTFKSGRWIDK